MTAVLLKAFLSYVLGSLMGSLLIARATGGVDIRTLGSGNAGATNAMRTMGRKVAVGVLLIDLAKGWVATALVAPWVVPGMAVAPEWQVWSVAVCGLAVMLGHVYPVFFGFRGGKGVATFVGALLGIAPGLLAPMVLTWLAVVMLTGFVSLGSMLGAAAVAAAIALSPIAPRTPLLSFAVLAALLVVFTHRSNIARMRAGSESRARRLWLLGRGRGAP
ncbi:MAG TPA: glycerol-3-phosphate 1-O-acyltransferase PlsY [Steroidobacteraceae bacterium]|nr:glycerol-3-phosphate 1-O-acyltransferase PlsY [Steroidobacteraceae bacterium]